MTIHSNLRQLRLARGMTQEQAAEQLHLTRQAISSYESGRTRPDVETLLRFAELYGTDLDAILYGTSQKQRARKRLKLTAVIVFALLTALTTLSSALLWTANRFYAMPPGGLTEAGKEIFAVRQRLMGAWETADTLLLTAALVGGLVLLVLTLIGKSAVSTKGKLIYTALLAGVLLCIGLLFGCTDPVYSVVDYLITPFSALCRLILLLLVSVAISALQQRKRTNQTP